MPSRFTLAALLLGGALLACSRESEHASSSSDEIVGGVAAKSSRLDAVGALGRVQPDGSFKYFCTATLVAPRLLVTAKHCSARSGGRPYTESEAIHFGIGEDSTAPKRVVKVARTWMASLDAGGYIQRGADVAMMALEEPVEDIAPLPLVTDHLDASVVGARVSSVGYGIRDVARSSAKRRAGTVTIRATDGPLVQSAFASADELVSFVRREGGAAFAPTTDEPRVRQLWDKSILASHEVFVGVAPGDAQPCSGDSGGPLVARVGGKLAVFAVVSGSFKLTNRDANPCSVVGEVYATFPSDVQAMFDEATAATAGPAPVRIPVARPDEGAPFSLPDVAPDAVDRCPAITTQGTCSDGVAIRCIDAKEGPPRITRTDCTLLLQTCKTVIPTRPAKSSDGGVDAADAPDAAAFDETPVAECTD